MTENSQNAANSIRFSVSAGKQTKAVVTDNDNITGEHFGLYAYTTDNAWAAGTTDPNADPDVMNDEDIRYEGTAWTYSPLKFWSDKNISFFGYWPKDKTLANGSKVAEASVTTNSLPSIKFTQEVADPANMVDFLVAHALNKTKAGGTVVMPFKHALTRLNFQARLDMDLGTESANTKVFVKGLKLLGTNDNAASKFYGSADYQLADGGIGDVTNGEWKYDNATPVATTLDISSIMDKAQNLTVGAYNYPDNAVTVSSNGENTNLLKNAEYLFLIPPSANGIENNTDVMIEITYDIVTVDSKLGANQVYTAPRVETISLPVGKLLESKAYNVVFTIGMNAITVDADVTEWDEDEVANAPSIEAESSSNANIIAAWEKLNTVKAENTAVKYFVINVPDVPTGNIDLSSTQDAQIANFALGDQVELRFNGQSFAGTVACPQGWSYQKRTVNNEEHYILIKSEGQNFITKSDNANCYMIKMNGRTTYLTFPLEQATLGWNKIMELDPSQNTDIATILATTNCKIKTLWKTWGGTTSVTGEISSDKSTATLTIPKKVTNGNNAVVALVSEDEQTVYWSWHLWFTDYEPGVNGNTTNGQVHQYISDAFQSGIYVGKHMMDRNLGATITGITGAINQPKTTNEAVKYYGLFYQFGRKDPFVGSRDGKNGISYVRRYEADGTAVEFKTAVGTTGTDSKLAYAVNHPLEFLTKASGNWTTETDGLWGEDGTKSVFDPCPPGWRVPIGGPDPTKNPWAGFRTSNPSETDSGTSSWEGFAWQSSSTTGIKGRMYNNNGIQAWYPTSGRLASSDGTIGYISDGGYYWGATPNSQVSGCSLYFSSSNVYPNDYNYRAFGRSVRCIQE